MKKLELINTVIKNITSVKGALYTVKTFMNVHADHETYVRVAYQLENFINENPNMSVNQLKLIIASTLSNELAK